MVPHHPYPDSNDNLGGGDCSPLGGMESNPSTHLVIAAWGGVSEESSPASVLFNVALHGLHTVLGTTVVTYIGNITMYTHAQFSHVP